MPCATSAMAFAVPIPRDRKSTRLNSSHGYISYAVFCLKTKDYPAAACPRLNARPLARPQTSPPRTLDAALGPHKERANTQLHPQKDVAETQNDTPRDTP